MSNITKVIVVVLLVFVFIRTISYVLWNWKNDNKLGSIMTLSVSIAAVALPLYIVFFKT